MRITTRVGRGTYVSTGCLFWAVLVFLVIGLIGWAYNAATGHAATVSGYSVRITPVTQDYTEGCEPATSSMLLSAFGMHVSQDRLILQMHTSDRGTISQTAVGIDDDYLSHAGLQLVSAGNLATPALVRVLTAQLRAHHPVVLGVWGNLLPWRLFLHEGPSGHWMIATGIRGQTVTVFDPETRAHFHGGWHQVPAASLARPLNDVFIVTRLP